MELAKDAANEGAKQLGEIEKELRTKALEDVTEQALKTKLPSAIVHSIHDFAKKGVDTATKKVADIDLESKIEKSPWE